MSKDVAVIKRRHRSETDCSEESLKNNTGRGRNTASCSESTTSPNPNKKPWINDGCVSLSSAWSKESTASFKGSMRHPPMFCGESEDDRSVSLSSAWSKESTASFKGSMRHPPKFCGESEDDRSVSLSSDWSKESTASFNRSMSLPFNFCGESEDDRSKICKSPEQSYQSMKSDPSSTLSLETGDESSTQEDSSTPQLAGPNDVSCNLCRDRKFQACKACLTCSATFCAVHVKDHYKIPALQRHTLVEVTENVSLVQENANLRQTVRHLREEMAMLKLKNSKSKIPKFICTGRMPVAADVTLDVTTAHRTLLLSDDRKCVRVGDQKMPVGLTSQRFDRWPGVLAQEGFSAGRYCWHTKVNHEFTIGVSRQTAARKGHFSFCPSQGYWCLYRYHKSFTALQEPLKHLGTEAVPQVLGVCVDVDEKWVMFYNAETMALIYTFETMNFADGEEIFPVFSTSERSMDLVITTVLS